MDKYGVRSTRASSQPPSELQDIAQKLSALAKQIKSIAATPLGDTVKFDNRDEASHRAAID